ncbi:MAG: cysteine rich repeat-containing protein [Nitrospira sp.]|nr:cysteine rich repeat-containing protein [Nitrospira sp.]
MFKRVEPRALRGPVLMAGLLWCALALLPAVGAAADPAAPASKPAGEQSPEQAAGGRENFNRMRAACAEDAKRHCKGVMPGGGRIIKCLRKHESELTSGCRAALPPVSTKP